MVVIREGDSSLLVVRQADHAGLSAQLAGHWRRPRDLPAGVWARFLHAVRCHDDGWDAAESFPALCPAGSPCDFASLPAPQHLTVWRRSIGLAEQADLYAALLVAQHARRLYICHPAESDPVDQRQAQMFINETALLIDRCLQRLQAGAEADRAAADPFKLATAAALLQAFDALSLMLLGALPLAHRTEALAFDDDCRRLVLSRAAGSATTFRIQPWPFAAERLEVSCPGRRVHRVRFLDPEHLAQVLAQTAPTDLRWALAPAA